MHLTNINLPFSGLNFENEITKIAILRILFSIIFIIRYWEIYLATEHLDTDPKLIVLITVGLAFGALCAVGFLTPICLISLNVLVIYLDKKLGIYNLGTAGFSNVCFLLFFTQSGHSLSVDYFAKRKFLFFNLLYPSSWRTPHSLQSTLLFTFIIFGIVNLASVFGHLLDPFWLNGQALQITFQNPFYSRYFELISAIANAQPLLYQSICILAEFFQISWQLLMVPLIFFRWGRIFVCGWGVIFLGLSLILLKLSYLSSFLCILWFALFFNSSFLKDFSFGTLPRNNLFEPLKQPAGFCAVPFITMFIVASFFTSFHFLSSRFSNQNIAEFRYDLLKQELPGFVINLFDFSAIVGLLTPNVFNTPDVLAAKTFIVVEKQPSLSEKWVLVPFIGYKGERLEYNSNNLIYYGVSIPLRRCIQIKSLDECSHYVQKIISYDRNLSFPQKFQYRIIFQHEGEVTSELVK